MILFLKNSSFKEPYSHSSASLNKSYESINWLPWLLCLFVEHSAYNNKGFVFVEIEVECIHKLTRLDCVFVDINSSPSVFGYILHSIYWFRLLNSFQSLIIGTDVSILANLSQSRRTMWVFIGWPSITWSSSMFFMWNGWFLWQLLSCNVGYNRPRARDIHSWCKLNLYCLSTPNSG